MLLAARARPRVRAGPLLVLSSPREQCHPRALWTRQRPPIHMAQNACWAPTPRADRTCRCRQIREPSACGYSRLSGCGESGLLQEAAYVSASDSAGTDLVHPYWGQAVKRALPVVVSEQARELFVEHVCLDGEIEPAALPEKK